MAELFHAYIVGGTRESAKAHIETMLRPYNLIPGNPDFVVSEHVNFSIDNARSIRAWQELAAISGRKAYVVYADFITREAENALLKTLEEPTPGTHIFFAVPKPSVLLETLLSRVQVITPEDLQTKTDVAESFLAMSVPERMNFVQKMLEKSDDDDAAAEVRQRALTFIDALEKKLSEKLREGTVPAASVASLVNMKKYLFMSGASVRLILETLALTIA